MAICTSKAAVGNWTNMPIESLTICDWANTDQRDHVIQNPSWSDVENAIRSLDNKARNDLYLKPLDTSQDTFLGVGGGDGKYIVHGSEGGERFPTLSGPTGTDERLVPLCVGGQLAEYPARWIVDLDRTLAAVKMFYEAGTFDCGVKWEYF
jgi:hypothetical protein